MGEIKVEHLQLTDAQFAFMQEHHEEIEYAYDASRRGNGAAFLETVRAVANSQEYKRLFGDMGWDDAFDRYEDTPGYDPTLRDQLIQQFQADAATGRFPTPENESNATDDDKHKTVSLSQLRRKLLNE